LPSETLIVLIALSAGIVGGIFTPLMAWLGSTEKFNTRKFIHAVLTCTVSGLVFGIIALQAVPQGGIIVYVVFWFEIFFASIGVDYARNKVGNSVRTGT